MIKNLLFKEPEGNYVMKLLNGNLLTEGSKPLKFCYNPNNLIGKQD